MKAIVRSKYGSPEVLSIKEVDTPIPTENEVLVRVYATTVNRTDCANLWAKPFIMRFIIGLLKPKVPIPGTDFAGIVEKIGKRVTKFNIGDKVWGFDDSGVLQSQAQYMTILEDKNFITFPENISYEQAAASVEGTHYAYNFLNKVELKKGQKVLINGATGAIGSSALQLSKAAGAYVTAVCNTSSISLIKSLGADKVIDYLKNDFTKDNEKYDYVFDTVGKSTFSKCKSILKPNGVYISSELGPFIQNPFLALITPALGGKQVKFPIPINVIESLQFIKKLIEEEKFKAVIDKTFPIENIRDAYNYVATGEKIGNVVITYN